MPKGALGRAARRRLRAGRWERFRASLGPTLFGVAWFDWCGTALSTGIDKHAAVAYYVVMAVGLVTVPVAAVGAAAGARTLSGWRAGPLRRWQYALIAVACLTPLAGAVVATTRTHGEPFWWTANWLSEGLGEITGFCVACIGFAGLLMLGRAVLWGRARRWCWLSTPPWTEFTPELVSRLAEQDLAS